MYYNARWYDSQLGRFAQADTIVPGGVQGYDRYAYVNNNPLRYTDPSGHSVDCGLGDAYCNAGVLDVKKKALDLANHYHYNAEHGSVMTWDGLRSQQSIFTEGGWTVGVYTDHVSGGVSKADVLHDPLTYIEMAVVGRGLIKAGYTAIVLIGAQLATQNPDGTYTIIGGYPKYEAYAKANGYTYFSLGDAYRPLNALGLAEPINKQFILNQIAQAKDFVQVSLGGSGTAMEVALIISKGSYTINELAKWSNFTAIFTYTP